MANIVRKTDSGSIIPAIDRDPFQAMREMLSWDPFVQRSPFTLGQSAAMFPQFDVKETKEGYVFKADVPGIEEQDLNITLTGNRLTISGKRDEEQRNEGDAFYTYERSYGSFTRSFTVPAGVNADHVQAELKNGVLHITLPKKLEHQPKKISLQGMVDKVKGAFESKGGRA